MSDNWLKDSRMPNSAGLTTHSPSTETERLDSVSTGYSKTENIWNGGSAWTPGMCGHSKNKLTVIIWCDW